MKKRSRITLYDLIPFIAFLAIFLFFTFASYKPGKGFMMLKTANLYSIIEQTMQVILISSGTLFVVAQGSIDLSVGVNLALSGVIGVWVATATGIAWLFIPVTIIVGLVVGVFNGIMVGKFKISSFMVTLAMLIGVRGLVNFIQAKILAQRLDKDMISILNSTAVKVTMFLVIVVILCYVFEFTKAGRYSRAIGENETTARFIGIPVKKMKIIAFALSGLMAGVGGVFSLISVGSTSQQMGIFVEMRVAMAIYLGGVLVTGGSTAKFYKILLGSLSIEIIVKGLALMGRSDSHISQSVQGILLLLILFISALFANKRTKLRKTHSDEPPAEIGAVSGGEVTK